GPVRKPKVERLTQGSVNKVDLLLDIDNSRSMADKQAILVDALPKLVGRLVSPLCVKENGKTCANPGECTSGVCLNGQSGSGTCQPVVHLPQPMDPGAPCDAANGFKREFKPITDMHIGVVDSSLGNRGAMSPICPDQYNDPVCMISTTSTNDH